ncbi:MAG: peroxidase-related enzyme [Planctomycetes bacterium]|nr:peroxidase-related enzyme [Planctomycetota bacterium]
MAYIETIAPADADGELAELYRRVANRDGTVDSVMTVHALNPESLRTHFEMYLAAMHRPSPLDRAERELVAVVASRLNGCAYCLRHHLAGLKRLLPEERHAAADDLATGRVARLTDREAALVAYATKLTTNPHDMDADDVERLRAAGLDDRAILDLAQVVSYFAYVNRMVRGLGVDLEGGDFEIGQGPGES